MNAQVKSSKSAPKTGEHAIMVCGYQNSDVKTIFSKISKRQEKKTLNMSYFCFSNQTEKVTVEVR